MRYLPNFQGVWEQVKQEFACPHSGSVLTLFENAAGAKVYRTQCRRCGAILVTLKGDSLSPSDKAAARPFDASLLERWQARMRQRQEDLCEERRRQADEANAAEDRDWRTRYEEHLRSPAWRSLRERVFARCDGACEGCGVRRATEVHHKTYERLGQEMLFDLIGVCRQCHEAVHQSLEPARSLETSRTG